MTTESEPFADHDHNILLALIYTGMKRKQFYFTAQELEHWFTAVACSSKMKDWLHENAARYNSGINRHELFKKLEELNRTAYKMMMEIENPKRKSKA